MKSSELKGYVTGLLLGDGYIDKGVRKRAFRLKTVNMDFAEEVAKNLDEHFEISVKHYEASVRNGVNRKAYAEVSCKAHPYFAKKYPYFYDDNRKRRITKESLKSLTIEGLANWYMSDGYIVHVGKNSGTIKYRRVELATDRYSKYDVEKTSKFLKEQYGLETSLVKRKEGVYRLRLNMDSAQKFFIMIAPFVVPTMEYKINLNYEYQPAWMLDEYYTIMNKIMKCEAPNNSGDDIV